MAHITTLEDAAACLGINVIAAARIERETGAVGPFVRVMDHGVASYVDAATALAAHRAGKQTGYGEAIDPAIAIAAKWDGPNGIHATERAARDKANREAFEARAAKEAANTAAYNEAVAAAGLGRIA